MNQKIKNKIINLYKNKPFIDKTEELDIYNIEYMYNLAKEREGKCLSNEFISLKHKLIWECKEGHIWTAEPKRTIFRQQWCPRCSKKNSGVKKPTIEELQKIANDRGGKLISTTFENCYDKLTWECAYGHRWEIGYTVIKHNKRWCPKCRISYGENISREVLETIFNKPFPITKPEWLINPETQRTLELDGYNEELKLAFEYNGVQHYENNIYSKTKNQLETQLNRDNIKKQICEKKGIKIITIPHTIKNENIKNYIIKELNKLGYNIKKEVKINKKNIYRVDKHKKFKEKANKLGYELLSPYNGALSNVTLSCDKGHVFTIAARSIDRNKGCPVCSGYRPFTTEELIEECKLVGLELIDEKYIPGKRFTTKCKKCEKVVKLRRADLKNYKCKCKEGK